MLDFPHFIDEVNARLRLAIDLGAGCTVWFTEANGNEAEWRREGHSVRIAPFSAGGGLVTRLYRGTRCGATEAVVMDDIGADHAVSIIIDHVARLDRPEIPLHPVE